MPSNDNRSIHITNKIWKVDDIIDHNPMYDEQRRADESARELRDLRDDMESRYRESQMRERWKNPSVVDKTSYITPVDREKYEEIGEIAERSEKRNKNTDSLRVVYHPSSTGYIPTHTNASAWNIVYLIALAAFAFFLFRTIVAL